MSPLRPTGRLKQQGSEAVVETAGGCQPRLVGGLQVQPGLVLRGQHSLGLDQKENDTFVPKT